jgi:hypothetical protein
MPARPPGLPPGLDRYLFVAGLVSAAATILAASTALNLLVDGSGGADASAVVAAAVALVAAILTLCLLGTATVRMRRLVVDARRRSTDSYATLADAVGGPSRRAQRRWFGDDMDDARPLWIAPSAIPDAARVRALRELLETTATHVRAEVRLLRSFGTRIALVTFAIGVLIGLTMNAATDVLLHLNP